MPGSSTRGARMRLEGKAALITGAGSGIGRETARRFAAEGAAVACADLRPDAAAETARELDGVAITVDVADRASVEAAVEQAASALAGLDVVVCNAGVTIVG